MPSKITPPAKVGLFVALVLIILAYATVRVSQHSFMPGGTYNLYMFIDSANGISHKTPVNVAGIPVGVVSKIDLVDNRARLKLEINKEYKISQSVVGKIKSVGFLGDTYVELYQPGPMLGALKDGDTIPEAVSGGDFGSISDQVGDIAADIKAITTTMKRLMAGDDSAFAKSLNNIERITASLGNVIPRNEQNLNAIIVNLRAISENLNMVVARDISSITGKINSGQGTLGRLVNDDETVDKINESLDSLNNLLGGTNRSKIDIGYHGEYMGQAGDFKNYVSFNFKPKPDKYFMFELVSDPAPDTVRETKITDITSGGVTTRVREDTETNQPERFRYSAELAKKFYNLTLRGGLIETSGGAGLDYDYGPLGIKFSAFDLETKHGESPHLKAMANFNVTQSFYLLGGADDFISKTGDKDYFLGAGVQLTDDDLKSLLGVMALKPK